MLVNLVTSEPILFQDLLQVKNVLTIVFLIARRYVETDIKVKTYNILKRNLFNETAQWLNLVKVSLSG